MNNVSTVIRLSVCVIIGASTHVLWDSLTHQSGYLVSQFPVLQASVTDWGGTHFYAFDALQHASTIFGATVILIYFKRWLRTADAAPKGLDARGDRTRYILLATLATISLLTAAPIAYAIATPAGGATNVFVLIVRFVIVATTIATLLISTMAIYLAGNQRSGLKSRSM